MALIIPGLFESESPPSAVGQAGTGLSLTFIGQGGDPLPDVGVHLFSSESAAPIFEAETDADGILEWPDAVEGEYDLIIHALPDGIVIPDADRVLPVTIDAGQRLVLTAQLRTTE